MQLTTALNTLPSTDRATDLKIPAAPRPRDLVQNDDWSKNDAVNFADFVEYENNRRGYISEEVQSLGPVYGAAQGFDSTGRRVFVGFLKSVGKDRTHVVVGLVYPNSSQPEKDHIYIGCTSGTAIQIGASGKSKETVMVQTPVNGALKAMPYEVMVQGASIQVKARGKTISLSKLSAE